MGTFTVSYWAKRAIWDKRYFFAMLAAGYYYGSRWDEAGMYKASMMKGHSNMFAERNAAVPPGQDTWKW